MSKLYLMPPVRQPAGNRRLRVPRTALFLSTALLGSFFSNAQGTPAPGGITTPPSVWYKPDGATATAWADVSGNGINLSANGTSTVTVNAGDAGHNFNSWTTGYSPANYYLYTSNTNALFGVWGDTAGGYRYTPLTVFGAARANTAGNGAITGLDNDASLAAEPGFGVQVSGGALSPRSYRFGNSYNVTAASLDIPLAQTSVYLYQPPPGNASAGTGDLIFGLNGTQSVTSGVSARSSVAGPHLNVGYDGFTFGAFPGDIQEVIWYKATLSTSDINKVESYLALKYGTTLSHDYVSNSGTLYSMVTNAGYTANIAGIVRDDASGLYQKQSNSVSTGRQVLISTTDLANTNAANTGTLSNGQALIWGDNGLAKIPSVSVTNIPGTNYRFASVWKVQHTGTTGTVRVAWPSSVWASIKLVQSSDPTFASGNTITDMTANTQVVNGVTYSYADVMLSDGQYFTFAAFVQTPGGVALPAVWLKADAGTDTSVASGKVSGWQNYGYSGGIAGQLSQSPGTTYDYPYLINNIHNFNPAVVDSVTNANGGLLLANVFPGYAQRALSTFVLQSQPDVTQQRTMVSFGNNINFLLSPDVPWFASQSATQLYFWWDGSYQQAPALPNALKRFDNTAAINAYYRRQWASNPDTTTLSMNGALSIISGNSAASLGIGNHLYIHADGGNNNASGGSISEILSYDRDLTSEEKLRINSYFSIKYGITLLTGNGGAVAYYLNSAGDTVWNANANGGNAKNIAGIAYDYPSGLNQKQSVSENAGKQVLIGTTGLNNTNALNTTGLTTDGQFLLWGDNGLAKAPSVAITNIPGTNYRFASVWKVQNTGSVGTVRVAWPAGLAAMKLVQGSDSTFASGNTITDMAANTQAINGITYNYADVTLADGQYFTFAAFVQAPGGVAGGLLMWHKADDGTSTPGAKSTWKDMSPNGRDVSQDNNTAYQPALVTASADTADNKVYSFNYNPFYYFDGTNDFFYRLNDNYFPADTSAGSTYSVLFNSASGGWRTPYGWGDDDPNLVRGNGDYAVTRDNGTVIQQTVNADNIPAHIAGFSWKGSGAANNGIYLNVNGRIYGTSVYNIGNIDNNDHNFAIGSEGFALTGNGNEVFQGGIPEVFAYSTDHQHSGGNEKQRINSYLAIKYGITLSNDSGTAVPDYLSSASAVVWSATANTGYNNNIAGLAYDYNSALQQKQSISENAGKQVLIGTTGLANTNALNATALAANGQFLIWGDNGLAKAPGIYMPGVANVNVRFKSVWKVQNTGSIGTVRVAWPAGLSHLSLIQSSDTTFDGSDAVTDMTANTQTVNGIAYNYADVVLSNGQYFTFASRIDHAPGGVFSGLSLWYRADKQVQAAGNGADVTSWTDYASGVTSSQVATVALPKFKQGDSLYFNFNPGVNFTAANQALANLNVQTVFDLNYDIFTLTKEGLSPGGNGRVFSSLVNNADQAGSINYWDGIGILADNRLERMNTAYTNRYLANPGNINWEANAPSIMYNTFSDTTAAKGLNGAAKGVNGVHTERGLFDGGHAIGTTQFPGNGSDNAGFSGNIGEVIVYGAGNITSAERNRVDAYLAIKYGVTLDTAESYLSSGNVVVWDRKLDSAYYRNVAGIAMDTLSDLHQKQSRSQLVNANNQVVIGLGDIYATNNANTGSLSEGQFLLWGDNGNTQAMTNVAATYTTFAYNGNSNNRRMNRVWKVRNSGVAQTVKLRFPIASVGTTTITSEDACANYAIVYAADAAFTTGLTVAPLTTNGTNYEALNNFPQGASYFTFAKVSSLAQGTVVLPATTTVAPAFTTCATNTWKYARQTASTNKYLAISGMSDIQLNKLSATITPGGTTYSNGGQSTRVMPRIATVTDTTAGTYTGVRVRVYYNPAELAATPVAGAQTNGWFKYEGSATALINDIDADGVFNTGMATQLTPDASGMEDGVAYVEFNNVGHFSSFAYLSSTQPVGVVLPVTFITFDAYPYSDKVALAWRTANEQRNNGFNIERSADGQRWNTIDFAASLAVAGNSNEELKYLHYDETPLAGISFYRLKQTDFDGKYQYSQIRQVTIKKGASIDVHPNPVKDYLNISGLTGAETINIFDATGRKVKTIAASGQTLTIDCSGMAAGTYHVHIVSVQGETVSKKIVKINGL